MAKEQTDGNLALEQQRVIVIPAHDEIVARKLRVAAYARVSSSSEDQLNSYRVQNQYYSELISNNPDWEMVDIYADEGITGTSVEKREDFQRMMRDCRKGKIDRILVKSISRFARNTKDCLAAVRELKELGVSVQFEEQGIDTSNVSSEMVTAIMASLVQKGSESISGNVQWGYQKRMRDGTFIPPFRPYGYKTVDKKIYIDEQQAEIVRQIFMSYLSGQSMDAISEQLNASRIPLHTNGADRPWRRWIISYILSNEKYTGDSLWQKTYTTATFPTIQKKNNGERMQYYVENTHPAIISISLNKKISDTLSQVQFLAQLQQAGGVDPDTFISSNNKLSEQLRRMKQEKARLLDTDSDDLADRTRDLMDVLEDGPDFLDSFDAELFDALVEKIIVDSNEHLRFRLKNGLELLEQIERTRR